MIKKIVLVLLFSLLVIYFSPFLRKPDLETLAEEEHKVGFTKVQCGEQYQTPDGKYHLECEATLVFGEGKGCLKATYLVKDRKWVCEE